MRQYIRVFGTACACLILVLVSVPAAAQSKPAAETETSTLQQRIEEHKAALTAKLSAVQQKKLQGLCVASQAKINGAVAQADIAIVNRSKVYQDLQTRLDTLVAKLDSQNVSTAQLHNDVATLSSKINQFNTDLKTYQQAVKDTASMDCVSDPTGFKASLEAARADRETVRKDAEDIRIFVTTSLKTSLIAIKDQLATAGGQ